MFLKGICRKRKKGKKKGICKSKVPNREISGTTCCDKEQNTNSILLVGNPWVETIPKMNLC